LLVGMLVGLAAGGGGGRENKFIKAWMNLKVGEDCWGEENTRIRMIQYKKAVAECTQTDAPELELPPFRTPYRFINTLMNYANKMDERQALHIYRTMQQVRRQFGGYRFNNDRYSDEVRPYMMDDDNMEEMEFDFTPSLEKMIKDMMMGKRSSSHNSNRMSNMDSMMYSNSKNSNNMMKHAVLDMDNPFENPSKRRNSLVDVVRTVLREKEMMESMMKYKKEEEQQYNPFKSSNSYRYKRQALEAGKRGRMPGQSRNDGAAAGGATTLPADISNGDKLKERLEQMNEERQATIGNMTCVMRKMKVLNRDNELDFSLQRRSLDDFNMPDPWFRARVVKDLRVCNLVAEALPAEAQIENYNNNSGNNSNDINVNMSKLKSFVKCYERRAMRTCMARSTKEKIEENFGRLEDIARETQLEEDDLLMLVAKLLIGDMHMFSEDF